MAYTSCRGRSLRQWRNMRLVPCEALPRSRVACQTARRAHPSIASCLPSANTEPYASHGATSCSCEPIGSAGLIAGAAALWLFAAPGAVEGLALVVTGGLSERKRLGAAAVLYRGRQKRALRYHLGPDTEHTVFEGEVVGSGLGTELLRTERKRVRTASMYIDNQASIRSTQSSRSKPGHYLTDHLNRQMLRVFKRHPDLRLKICWIPGHMDVDGNEAVDIEAKKASTEGSSFKPR